MDDKKHPLLILPKKYQDEKKITADLLFYSLDIFQFTSYTNNRIKLESFEKSWL
jgi:hypothetical protein